MSYCFRGCPDLTGGFVATGPGLGILPLVPTARRGGQGAPQARPATCRQSTLDDPGAGPWASDDRAGSAALRLTYVLPPLPVS